MTVPPHFHHRIERTKNRYSRAVLKSDTIVIRLARNLSTEEEEQHVQELLRRMQRQVERERRKHVIDPFHALFGGEPGTQVTLASGRTYIFTLSAGSETRAIRTKEGWHITVGPHTKRTGIHRLLWKALSALEEEEVTSLVHRINAQTFRVPITHVRLRFASSQWGSCTRRGTIHLNAALLFVPPAVLHYIIVHELAHRREANHSPAYWKLVAWAMPSFREARRLLAGERLPAL